jgi:HlyD family secretion protein
MTTKSALETLQLIQQKVSGARAALDQAAHNRGAGLEGKGGVKSQAGAEAAIRRHIIIGMAAAALLVGGLGAWAATSEVSGAVVAAGHLVVESNLKAVQHPSGGVVKELHIRNGDAVKAGDVVLRLDDTLTRANLAILTKGLDELSARRARLSAEREGAEEIAFPAELAGRSAESHVAGIIEGERKLFELRRAARQGQTGQLRKRISQLEEEILGIRAQKSGKEREAALIREELKGVQDLWEKKLIQHSRLLELQRGAARLEGERGQMIAAIAQAEGRTSEMELAIIQIEQDLRSEVANELREAEAKTAELEERRVAAEELLRQTEVRAPQTGLVHELAVHTVGGVIAPGESIMHIVPGADELTVEARVAPQDIDQVQPGQPAFLRLSAFNQQTTPELAGEVRSVSPDLVQDARSGVSYYAVRIGISDIPSEEEPGLKPGMPVEVFMRTSERTVMSYLLKPMSDQVSRAFRE